MPSPEPKNRSRRTLAAGIIVIVVIAVVVAAVALAMNNINTFSNTNSSSDNPNQAQTNIQGASSLKFSLSYTQEDSTQLYAFTVNAKNIRTQDMMLRIEGTLPGVSENAVYIINGVQQKAWMYSNNQWIDLSDSFNDEWDRWSNLWGGYFNDLTNWSGIGDYTYTSPSSGDTMRIYDIEVNPSLDDALFAP